MSTLFPVMEGLAGWFTVERYPGRHRIADLSSEKLNLHRGQCIEDVSCFSAMSEASLLYTTVAVVPIPSDVVNTSSENEPCSISLMRSSYALLFSSSLLTLG